MNEKNNIKQSDQAFSLKYIDNQPIHLYQRSTFNS